VSFYLKATRSGRRATHASGFVWPEHGEWFQVTPGRLRACEHGIHVCRPDQITAWLSDELHLIEVADRFQRIECEDKVVVRRARLVRQLPWDESSGRMLTADFAEHVLPLFERVHPEDDRPRRAIEVARARAMGKVGDAAWAAAGDAAWAAAGDAAWAAAGDAARAAAGAAAWAAARDAARAAAGAAAWAAARDAERQWQGARLIEALGIVEMQP